MITILKHIEIEGPGIFASYLKQAGLQIQTYELSQRFSLPALKSCSGILIMGGPMNVYEVDKYPFLIKEEEFLKNAIINEIPILGICLGAQILAKIAGAKIYKAPKKEIGFYDVFLTAEGKLDPLFKDMGTKNSVFQWHEDTFDIPERASLIAKGTKVINQAFRFNDYTWGLQYHPEITASLIRSWVKQTKESVDLKNLMQDYFANQDLYLKQAKKICYNFSTIIKGKNKL